jgi:DNA invertase Pin-like site-specific DNA recombinase
MERDLLLSRQSESIKRLREKGSKWGRGKLMSEETKSKIIALRQEGFSYRKICESVGVSKGSIQHLMSTVNG